MAFWKKRVEIPTEKYIEITYEGREIIIVDKSRDVNRAKIKKIKREILLFSKTDKAAKRFPKITFMIESHKKGDRGMYRAWVETEKLLQNKVIVYINAVKIKVKGIKSDMVHELRHITHQQISNWIKKVAWHSDRTGKILQKRFSKLMKEEPDTKDIREMLLLFTHLLPAEGQADYFKYLSKGRIIFNKKRFKKYYSAARKWSLLTKKQWTKYLATKKGGRLKKIEKAKKKFWNTLIIKLPYSAGFHMIYTLVYVQHINDLDKIAKMGPHKFVREYEKAMKIKGLQPVVSLTSGKGILDYNEMLAEWWKIVKQKSS
ncbi:hypothetical protein GOV03_01805 [Candidatus Woesearchaeota archaeon]|nr:hypothetical protein [Candidatus Woesearchaeota archaeon]